MLTIGCIHHKKIDDKCFSWASMSHFLFQPKNFQRLLYSTQIFCHLWCSLFTRENGCPVPSATISRIEKCYPVPTPPVRALSLIPRSNSFIPMAQLGSEWKTLLSLRITELRIFTSAWSFPDLAKCKGYSPWTPFNHGVLHHINLGKLVSCYNEVES